MLTSKYKILLICLWGTIFLSCWEKQDHEIMIPETPIYDITGRVLCSLTNEPLPQVDVLLSGVVKYNDQKNTTIFSMQYLTDEDGRYYFKDVPGGFNYTLFSNKEGYNEEATSIVVLYEDKDVSDVVIGKLLVFLNKSYYPGRTITGIVFQNKSLWIADTLNQKMVELNEDLTIKRKVNFLRYKSLGLGSDGEWFWTSDPDEDIFFNFQIDDWGHIIFDKSYPSPQNYFNPLRIIDFCDIHGFDDEIWGCTKQLRTKYFKIKLNESEIVDYFDSPQYYPAGIYVDSSLVYLASQYHGESKLFLLEKITNNIIGYYEYLEDAGSIAINKDFIWIANEDAVIKYSFK